METIISRKDEWNQLVAKIKSTPEYELERVLFEINEQLCELMERQGISRAELASRMGKSKAWVTKLLRDNRNLTIKTLVFLAHALDTKIDCAFRQEEVASGEVILHIREGHPKADALLEHEKDDSLEEESAPFDHVAGGTPHYGLAA